MEPVVNRDIIINLFMSCVSRLMAAHHNYFSEAAYASAVLLPVPAQSDCAQSKCFLNAKHVNALHMHSCSYVQSHLECLE